MWLIAEYLPTTLFSLKPSWATSSGGTTLLMPTAFAIKMALVDAVCRAEGVAVAEAKWPMIRDLKIAFRGPERLVVINTFTRILKPDQSKEVKEGKAHAGPLQKTIGFREYVFHGGAFELAFQVANSPVSAWLVTALLQINYFGKRGSFCQLLAMPRFEEKLPAGFVAIVADNGGTFDLNGVLQQIDDVAPGVRFEQVNIYSGKPLSEKDRPTYHIVLPYRMVRSSKSYTLYERIDR